jgi:hypothetical protein
LIPTAYGLRDNNLGAPHQGFLFETMHSTTSEQDTSLEDLEALKTKAIHGYLSTIGARGGAANKGKPGRSEIARRAAIARNLSDPGWQARIVRRTTTAAT